MGRASVERARALRQALREANKPLADFLLELDAAYKRLAHRLVRAVVVLAVFSTGALANDFVREHFRVEDGKQRRRETCVLFERDHRDDVRSLRGTYDYLVELHPEERGDAINRAVFANLPEVEREARRDQAPSYCDEPGVALPEPNPVIPDRPPELSNSPDFR